MDVIHPDFITTSVARSERWHDGDIDNWSKPDWMCAQLGELGEAAAVVEEQMLRAAGGEYTLSSLTITELLVLVMWQLGEAANAAKKLRRIEDDIANISERTLDIDEARAQVKDSAVTTTGLLQVLLQRHFQVGSAQVPAVMNTTAIVREHTEATDEELVDAFNHEMADVIAYHVLNLARQGLTPAEVNDKIVEVFNGVSDRYEFPEHI